MPCSVDQKLSFHVSLQWISLRKIGPRVPASDILSKSRSNFLVDPGALTPLMYRSSEYARSRSAHPRSELRLPGAAAKLARMNESIEEILASYT